MTCIVKQILTPHFVFSPILASSVSVSVVVVVGVGGRRVVLNFVLLHF